MKNQYFGDINDYRKYGLIRILSDGGALRVGMCWMLTGYDDRTDGKFTDYLDKGRKYRRYDEALFESLKGCLSSPSGRDVCHASVMAIIPNAIYHEAMLSDIVEERRRYFEDFSQVSQNCDLVFFDPDNGFEVRSTPKGRKNSCKYLYWDELLQTYLSGKSILVYQHFRHEKHEKTITSLSGEIRNRIDAETVMTFRTPHVLFFLISQPHHSKILNRQAKKVSDHWYPEIIFG